MSPDCPKPSRTPIAFVAATVWALLIVPALGLVVPVAMILSVDAPTGVYTYMYWALGLPVGLLIAALGCVAGGVMRQPRLVAASSALPFVVFAVVATAVARQLLGG